MFQCAEYSTSSPEVSHMYSLLEKTLILGVHQMASNFQEEEKPLPSQYETERFLREYLKIPEPMPLDLYALRDHFNPTDKPKPAIAALIALSIWGCPQKRLSLKEIYEAIEARYPSWSSFNPPDGKIPPWKVSKHSTNFSCVIIRYLFHSELGIHSTQLIFESYVPPREQRGIDQSKKWILAFECRIRIW